MNTTETKLLCRSLQVPTAEQVKDALYQAGYSASVEAESGSLVTRLDVELRYALDKMPIKITFGAQQTYNIRYVIGVEEGLWWQEMLPETMERKDVRRFITIDAQEDVDAGALQAVVDCIAAQANAVVAVKNVLSDTLL